MKLLATPRGRCAERRRLFAERQDMALFRRHAATEGIEIDPLHIGRTKSDDFTVSIPAVFLP